MSRHDLICINTVVKSASNFDVVVRLFESIFSAFESVSVGTLGEDPTVVATAVELCTLDNTADDHATNPADPTYERPLSVARDSTCSGDLPCLAPVNMIMKTGEKKHTCIYIGED